MNYIKPLPLAISLAMTAGLAHADSTAKKVFTLDKVSVAATLKEQKIEDVANTVSIIESEELEKINATDVRELLKYVPGVDVTTEGRFGINSINVRGSNENKVKIIVDGIDQAKSYNASSRFQQSGRLALDVDTLKQVEIVKGPASSIYGSNAIGGVVAFTTKDPSDYLAADGDDTAASIKTSYHSTDEETSATLSLANRTGNLESMLVYTRREGHETENMGSVGGTGTDRTKPNPEDNESDNLLLKLQYQINDAHRIGFTLEENNTESEGEVLTGLSRTYSKFDSSSEGERSRFSLKHEWNADLPLFDTAESTLSYQKSKKSNTSDQLITSGYGQIYGFTSPSPAPLSVTNEPRIKDYSYEEEQKQFNAVFTKKMENQTITYGVNVKETEFTSVANTLFENFDDDITRWSPLTEEFTYGVFIQNQITLLDGDFTLTPSIRYDSYETDPETDASFTTSYSGQKHNKTSFRLGSVYKINDNLSVFAQYAQGFKTPDLEDLYQYFVNPLHRYVITGNPNLKPEESDSYEIGVRYSNQVGELEVTAFYNDYEDYIEEISYPSTDPGQPGFTINQDVNIADANIRGLEVRGSVWLDEAVGAPSGTSLKVAIAYARGEGQNGSDADDVPLSTVAPLKGVIGLNYDAPNDFWGGSIDWTLGPVHTN